MKVSALCYALALCTGSILAAEVQPGASREEVSATLGAPRGQLHLDGRQVLYYERGDVELQNGVVTRVNLRSPEDHAIWSVREERLRGEREARRDQMLAEGTALRDRKLADPILLAAPVAYQVAFWEDFARRYPEVSCVEPLTIARLRLSEQIEDRNEREEQSDRLAGIEERFAAADRRPTFYPLFTSSHSYRRHHRHSDFAGLGPITYTFFDKPLPPYSTPSGNPAGNLTSPYFNPPALDSVRSERDEQSRSRWEREDQEDRPGRSHGRNSGAGSHRFRGRM